MARSDERPPPPALEGNHSKVIRHGGGFDWQGVALEAYKATTQTWAGISRRELVGKRGESTGFHVRYFEIAPGGFSTLEQHEHEHVVIPLRGEGEAQFGCFVYKVRFGDVVYVAPNDPHQFRNAEDAREPFGFLCIVDAERDAPEPSDGLEACYICE
ncbi:MAG: cupin domain-containing protein [Acidobacteria bacterium]|nr:cupin domain-containing protein [Acidobacteriota bacterium]MCZ6727245.1 cupin domain-containing protein [Acidobacteriota bacterium]